MHWFPTAPTRVSAFPFRTVLDPHWLGMDARFTAAAFNLPRKYLICPSQFWLHKNHCGLFEALRLIKAAGKQDVVVVCTGREHDYRHPGYFEQVRATIARHGLESNVRLVGLLDRATQVQLVRASCAVVQPSFFEGWSALVEDARALGKRIYVSDIAVHHEQNPEDAHFFDPAHPDTLADLISRDWDHLEPGPSLHSERRAIERQSPLVDDFVRRFREILERTQETAL
jgi:glycosyltransferase involved in cell wall biosynthesis